MASLDLDADDLAKVNALIVGGFGAIAAVRKYPGWQIDPNDALQLSKPLLEIIRKYPDLADRVLSSTAPIALITSAVWLIAPRIAADGVYRAEQQRAAAAEARRAAQAYGPPTSGPYQAGAQTVPPGQQRPSEPTMTDVSGFPKDLNVAARMWADDANGRAYDGFPAV